jgi:hypothetical protein
VRVAVHLTAGLVGMVYSNNEAKSINETHDVGDWEEGVGRVLYTWSSFPVFSVLLFLIFLLDYKGANI